MSTVRYIRILYILFAFLLGVPGEAWADLTTSNIIIDEGVKVGETNEYTIEYGSVTVVSVDNETRTVTITVTPEEGYYVLKSDILVQKLVDPGRSDARRRVPEIAEPLTVTGPDKIDGPATGTYTFIVPADYDGALVTVTISGKNPASAVITPRILTYNGTAQELVTLDGVTGAKFEGTVLSGGASLAGYYTKSDDVYTPCSADGTADGSTTYYKPVVTYSLTEAGPYSPTIPTRTDAGDYTVYYRVTGDGNYSNGIGSVTVTIQKALISQVTLAQSVKEYTGSELTFTISSVKAGTVNVPSAAYTVSGNMQTDVGNYTLTVTAIEDESHKNFTGSASATFRIVDGSTYKVIYSDTPASEVTNLAGTYILAADVDAAVFANLSSGTFTGTLDGNFHKITDLSTPLFSTINGGTVKNVILENVSISSGTNVGAIANEATGDTRIYNCGILNGSVGGSGRVGGLVGLLDGSARVINCYSYATITGGNSVGGIVGYNNGNTTAGNITTMVMNCMFYGDVTSGTTVSPVYGGNNINNLNPGGLNTFNYYAYDKLKTKAISSGKYNCALAVEEKYLTRFEFYRLLLNSNKKLAAYYASTSSTTVAPDDMAKWVLETADKSISDPQPYPILKVQGKYPSIINYDVEYAPIVPMVDDKPMESERNKGGKLGKTLTVHISIGSGFPAGAEIISGKSTLSIERTDKDYAHFNFNYDKVQLPYYNDVGTKNYTGNRVVTGWKITNITTVEGDPYTSSNYDYSQTYSSNPSYFDYPNYNFADRKSSNKDLYSVSGRVFSQGAYFDVPYGVTEITIEPYWGKAAYIADPNYDVVYKSDYTGKQNVTQTGTQVGSGATFNGEASQVIKTSISDALNHINSNLGGYGATVYDNAVVLVGNLHQDNVPSSGTTPFTIMSVDFDHDNEPDYSMIYHHTSRSSVSPIRFDFLNIPGTAQAQKPNGASLLKNFTIFKMKGWFEITNTGIAYSNQVEYENEASNKVDHSPLILLGGDFEQFVSTQRTAVPGKTIYIHVGSNVSIKSFGVGTHGDGSTSTPHIPVSVTGGEYEGFYLTGTYNPNAAVKDDNAECYISGGHFSELAGACQEQIGANTTTNGNVHWQIYNSDIDNFFGGGINDVKPVKGNITTDIFNSYVTTFCGGPKFGNMVSGKTVTTNAEGCVFGQYFGAGYGGVSYNRQKYYDHTSYNFTSLANDYTTDKGKYFDAKTDELKSKDNVSYGYKGPGVATDFDYEFFVWSSGQTGARFYVKFASFSLAQCDNVSSTLTGCTVKGNFYGGGSLGKVTGTATSVLDGCTVNGNVFGGGYSAALPQIPVRIGGFTQLPKFNSSSGMFEAGIKTGTEDYDWTHVDTYPANGADGTPDDNKVITTVDLDALGQVEDTDLTIKGDTYVAGNVFGGGDESAVLGNTKVDIQNSASSGLGYVYGGGNTADVDGNAVVSMTGGRVVHDVYGGGKGETTVVEGNVTVNIGTKTTTTTTDEPPVTTSTYAGKAIVGRNVYGGSALGNTNATKGATISHTDGTTTQVNLYGGAVTGSVFGGGLGQITPTPIASNVYGPVTVTVEGSASGEDVTAVTAGNVFGCNDQNGAPQSTVEVYIKGTAAATGEVANPIGNVYGGGNLAAYTGSPIVEMSGGTVGKVYGGGLGASAIITGNTSVLLSGGTVNQDVYGGGSEANVTGSVAVSITGGTVTHDVYGGGALADTNTDNWDSSANEGAGGWAEGKTSATNTTSVSLTGGTVGDAYGGGLGDGSHPAYVYGDVLVELNRNVEVTAKGAAVSRLFGANNVNGTPKGSVTVHVYKTQNAGKSKVSEKFDDPAADGFYDVQAVYGGGNEADYVPADTKQSTEVIIEDCDNTIVKDVYGGGNAAAVPATEVWILGAKHIENVFGGGNGVRGAEYAAHVGFHRNNDLSTRDYEKGSGETHVKLVGGTINSVYGGSNSHGDIHGGANILMPTIAEYNSTHEPDATTCELITQHIYGGGKNADMSSGTNIVLGCMPDGWINEIYAGAQAADVAGNVSLTITSGKFGRVFGGNKDSGKLEGSITVNIEETGNCDAPIVIGELYGGGNMADYSVYGFNDDGSVKTSGDTPLYADPQVNVRAFTSIGAIYGGGYSALMVGNPSVDINVVKGSHAYNDAIHTETEGDDKYFPAGAYTNGSLSLPYPKHKEGEIGAIGNVFGGGNLANVIGNTAINIGTESTVDFVTPPMHLGESGVAYTFNETTQLYEGVSVSGANITGSVYGGGNAADIIGITTVIIGTVDLTDGGKSGTNIAGDVFGGGLGETTTVTGNVQVNIGKKIAATESTPESYEGYATISGDVYGGSAKGKVNATKSGTEPSITYAASSGTTEVNFYGGTITGDLYGGGYGLDNAKADVYGAITVNVYKGSTTNTAVTNVFGGNNLSGVTRNTIDVNISGGTVSQDVYGGGNVADALSNVTVKVTGGTVNQNVYGGGNAADALSDVTVTVTGGSMVDVYGGGKGETTVVGGDVTVNIGTKTTTGEPPTTTYAGTGEISGNVYGGSALGAVNATKTTVESVTTLSHTPDKETKVNIYAATTLAGSVFGGGLGQVESGTYGESGYKPAIAAQNFGNTTVTMENGTVGTAIYGGANTNGVLKGNSTVTITGGTIHAVPGVGDPIADVVFGGGFGPPTRVDGDVEVNIGTKTGTSPNEIYSGSATINGNVYGGSAEGTVNGTTAESNTHTTKVSLYGGDVRGTIYGGGLGIAGIAANVYGLVTVTTKAGTAQNLFGCNNVNGAPQQTVTVNIDGGTIGNVYGGGNQAAYLYANAATPQNLQVNISGGTMENVFGGGLSAEVAGGISVSVTGGQVNSDVYGGGALAHTNTANWDDSKYVAVPAANITNGVSLVTGLYTEDGGNYTEITTPNTRADDVTTYYQKGDWKTGIIDGDGKTTYKTIVSLTGGIVGNAYGGGLGQMKIEAEAAKEATYYTAAQATEYNATLVGALNSTDALTEAQAIAYNGAMSPATDKAAGDTLTAEEAAAYNAKLTGAVKEGDLKTPATPAMEAVEGIAANVYGDVSVTVNGTAFTHEFVTPTDANGVVIPNVLDVPTKGRVFGCNNFNGTPMGNVLVEVDRTKRIEDDGTISDNHQENIFEIHSVYGGGNLATYQPATGKATHVIINGCDDTSIEKVFGGGNSASVPSTDVLILGTFYVGYAFSGGNGADMFQKGNVWFVNDGAPIYGGATIKAIGGKIGQVFGGSDTKGNVYGNSTTLLKGKEGYGGTEYTTDCDLQITNVYGAARGADIEGDVNFIISGCTKDDAIERVFGGSYDANIRGSITLTVTSGIFAQVFGGNDHGGTIGGEITVNVEETEDCENPIIIQYLYGGGREAEYPGTGAKYITNSKDANGDYVGTIVTAPFPDPDPTKNKNAKITVNVKSATRIDNLYGGSYRARVNGDTEVNINMEKGNWAIKHHDDFIEFPDTYRGDQIPNVNNASIDYKEATVIYPNEDNPGSLVTGLYIESVDGIFTRIIDREARAEVGKLYYQRWMKAKVNDDIGTIGNVFGGCYEGVVKGSTKVNIGTETKVKILKRKDGIIVNGVSKDGVIVNENDEPIYDSEGKLKKGKTPAYVDHPVLGAHISGNVFGGGENAEVTGNTEVNICVKENLTTHEYEKVAEGTSGVSIGYACKSGVSIEGSSVYGISKYGSVFGGGCRGDVLGNTTVRMYDGYIFNGIYGGGFVSSVGTFTRDKTVKTDVGTDAEFDHSSHSGVCLGKPISCKVGTGLCTVVVKGGQIGPIDVATEGMERSAAKGGPVIEGWIWGAGEGDVDDPKVNPDTHFKSYVGRTDVTVGGDAFILESIIGGGEFGRVLDSTKVTIQDNCQIGVGYKQTETVGGVLKPKRYTNDQFFDPIGKGESYINSNALNACSHYPYGRNTGTVENPNWVYDVQDPYADDVTLPGYEGASSSQPSDGRTWIGCVFGGGSGYVPYVKARNASTGKVTDYDWLPSAGLVEGNTWVDIQGGHILTNVYGGNEYTDVGGRSKVTMSGGTIGVPRSLDSIAAQPLICYLFGAGKGDQRAHFNTYTNVGSALVDVSGGIIYGSVFGGSEDGHVLGNVEVNIKSGAKIGTWGTSYVDGNIFGGGRGFSGETLGAGNVNGNITVNVTGGTMLGSIYGGGRMASVGTNFSQEQDPNKGQFIEDDDKGTHGHVTINISGGVIGNATPPADSDYSNSTHSGNVFGGSMGRLTLLNHEPNPLWTRLAQTKSSTINIDGNAIITRNVYGGAEFGTTRDNVNITIGSSGTPTINGSVFGGGLGSAEDSQEYNSTIIAGSGSSAVTYIFSPLQYAGCVGGNTNVTVKGGQVKKNVYGGGELASVGVIDLSVREDASGDITYDTKTYSYINAHKHADIADEGKTTEKVYGFGLSWPYEFSYILGGKATVNVTGGRIGTGYDNGTGYVFGGGKGQVAFKKKDGAALVDITDVHEQRYTEAFCANVRETEVNINYESTPDISSPQSIGAEVNCIMGAVYGGGEDGHVYENTAITLEKGLIGLSIYGGGKGEGTYPGKLYALSVDGEGNLVPAGTKSDVPEMPSWTAGKVYGNTSITMEGGHVMGNVYGGGNLGSVGKGNYAGGTDDYYPDGYGETLNKNGASDNDKKLWDSSANANSAAFLSSGKCTIEIKGGKVGTLNGLYGYTYGTTNGSPTGMVFGGSRGRAARDVGALSPLYNYAPEFFLGYANNTEVTIGTRDAATGPTIYSQVFGGGRDGHVRGSTKVEINSGTIGQTYAQSEEYSDTNLREYQRRHRGNVYGSGSGMGTWNGTSHGTSSGSVTRNTTVDIYGGTIYNNVYGGGAMASVGPPQIPPSAQPASKTWSKCTVNIYGGTIGIEADYEAHKYGGCVYGASRGGDNAEGESLDSYATTIWNDVNILPNPTDRSKDAVIAGDVYGGGEAGRVKKSNLVTLTGGIIKHDAYGGGKGTTAIAADVGGDATVELNGSTAANGTVTPVLRDKKGCVVNRIFGCNNINGSPKGHAKVHVHRTQNPLKAKISEKFQLYHKYTPTNYADLLRMNGEDYEGDFIDIATQLGVTIPTEYLAVLTTNAGSSSDKQKQEAEENIKAVLSAKYDVQYVYGGGNLAMYVPTDLKTEYAEVIIDGCDLTSIYTAYGGGNAASTPANRITIWGTYEIDQVFGGGNGKDPYELDGIWYVNSGADVGYRDMTYYIRQGETGYVDTLGLGTKAVPYKPIIKTNARTKEGRQDLANGFKYGAGSANTDIYGGTIHTVYGGSNEKGNICTAAVSTYEEASECDMHVDYTYGAGKNAPIDGVVSVIMECVENIDNIYGGSTNADVLSDIHLQITNGTFKKVFGGNNTDGAIYGTITVDVEERGCQPIIIEELYAAGYLAPYSVYGYKKKADGSYDRDAAGKMIPLKQGDAGALATPFFDPCINIISATRIDNLYGGGFQAEVVGSPHVNVNMTNGMIKSRYVTDYAGTVKEIKVGNDNKDAHGNTYTVTGFDASGNAILAIGTIGTIFGGGNEADIFGNTYVDIGTGEWLNEQRQRETLGTTADITTPTTFTYMKPTEDATSEVWTYQEKTTDPETEVVTYYPVAIVGNPTPSRNAATIKNTVYGGGNQGDVTGNTHVTMANGSVEDRIYGGCDDGNVGTITEWETPEGHDSHANCIKKPKTWKEGTGKCTVTISGGKVGKDGMKMAHLDASGNLEKDDKGNPLPPDDYGYVFGAGRGVLDDPENDPDVTFKTYVYDTEVVIKNSYLAGHEGEAEYLTRPLILGGVYGGSENGRVRHDTDVKIQGGQIGVGIGMTEAYTEAQWTAAEAAVRAIADATTDEEVAAAATAIEGVAMAECEHWPYGRTITRKKKDANGDLTEEDEEVEVYLPYDEHGDDYTASIFASDGHTFYGNVFGGGSGYFSYLVKKASVGDPDEYEWLESAGAVEGDTHVTISGGHVMTNVYGGNEVSSNTSTGTCYVTMTGGSLGVPRTLKQIDDHPVTCYLFGAGKGDQRTHFNKRTDVGNTEVTVSGGIIYGSIFGGGEDGHVLGNAKVTVQNTVDTTDPENPVVTASPWIGTWGTSYVDGNVFGGGRGFSGDALTAGVVCGNVDMAISGGTMLGSIYGGGRLGSVGAYLASPTVTSGDPNPHYGALIPDGEVEDNLLTEHVSLIPDVTHGYITVDISGGTIGNKYEFVNVPTNIEPDGLEDWENNHHIPKTEISLHSTEKDGHNNDLYLYRLAHTKGGNVFAGGMGRRTQLDGKTKITAVDWTKLGSAKSTKLTISGDVWIMGNVYGGGEFGALAHPVELTNAEHPNTLLNEGGSVEININGGTIGTEIKSNGEAPQKATIDTPAYSKSGDSPSDVIYTFGSVFGGGYGTDIEHDEITQNSQVDKFGALVSGNTTIKMTAGHVRASVYGGGEMAAVGGNTNIDISGGEIGRNEVYGFSSGNPGYVRFGSSTMGNVYGGGMGKNTHTLLGVVKGNTTVNINPGVVAGEPKIYHNVYGGGALGSVGTFNFSDGVTPPMDNIPKGNPFHWESGGVATVNIKGGTIGISGRDNGMVNGSSRGDVAKPVLTLMGKDKNGNDNYIPKDPYDKMAWVAQSIVTIGADDTPGPHIKGSVYGGGENGHVFTHATVNVKSGTIGIVNEADPWFDYGDEAINEKAWVTRGNVYGAGCGTDTYWDDKNGNSKVDVGEEFHNTWAGCVIGNTDVNISGGWVAQCVYGGGSLGSVGRILDYKITEHHDDTKEFAISWPVGFTYEDLSIEDPVFETNATGKTIVNITGGRIGTTGSDNGDVFGSTRGEAGADRYKMAQLANVKETYVNINYPESSTATPENYKSDMTQQCITGSVYGGSENGHVNGDTHVLMNNGLVGHSIYGGGKGKTKVLMKLVKIGAVKKDGTTGFNIEDFEEEDVYDAKSYSFTAGKVYGNTYVDMRGGYVLRNIYGGGNMASVGKGNYAGGPDDYFTLGYGELTGTKNLWTSEEEGDLAWHFLNTGKTNVTVTGGQVGYIASDPTKSIKDGLPYGNIFGGCRGEATPNINEIPPYFFNPTFYSGFVNESNVNIGGDYRCIKKCTDVNDDVHLVGSALHLDSLKNAFGVETPDVEYWEAIAGDGPKIYGSVYGGGQDGHVRRDAHVTVNKGEIGILYDDANRELVGTSSLPLTEELDSPQWLFRGNVFGSGSGIGKYEYDFNYNGSTYTDVNGNGEYDEGEPVDGYTYGGEPVKDIDYGISAGSVTRFSQVDIFGGTIYRNVYGGGSRASVGPPFMGTWALKRNDADASTKGRQSQCTVNIKGTVGVPFPKTEGDPDKYNEVYGGVVYGASRGDDTVGDTFSTCIWTQVNIKNGAVIRGNVFGGGDAGSVKKNTDVIIGAE